MPGGILQLMATGAQNLYLNGNPSLSFFKKVFKTHTHFSTESMRLNFNRTTMNVTDTTTLICKIDRNADMLQNLYFAFSIPHIGKKDGEKFKFVQNLGEAIIDNYYITIGGNIVDRQYGEWMHCWNEMSLSSNKTYGYSKLIGNVADIYAPDDYSRKFTEGQIQVFGRKIYVPLLFWFNKIPGLAIPLISMQYHSIELHVELRPLIDIFTVGNSRTSTQESTTRKPTKADCENYFNVQNNAVHIDPYVEANYIFLDQKERTFFAKNDQTYLIEQVSRFSFDNLKTNNIITLDIHNPVKEFIWVLSRSDKSQYNRWFDFVDWDNIKSNAQDKPTLSDVRDLTDSSASGEILKSARFMFNGQDRMETKDNFYFNIIQPYQHHTFIPKSGIYCYSFSLNPEAFQPSGSCNFSKIRKLQMYLECIAPQDSSYTYELNFYSVNYNFLEIRSGLGGTRFAS